MPSNSDSKDGAQCWVAAGDRRQSFTPRRATPAYFEVPPRNDVPGNTYDDLLADIREGLEEVFDRPGSRAPFIPGYENKNDAIARVQLLRNHGQESSGIILVRLRDPHVIYYRRLKNYAGKVSYQGTGLESSTDQYIICEPFTQAHIKQAEVFN